MRSLRGAFNDTSRPQRSHKVGAAMVVVVTERGRVRYVFESSGLSLSGLSFFAASRRAGLARAHRDWPCPFDLDLTRAVEVNRRCLLCCVRPWCDAQARRSEWCAVCFWGLWVWRVLVPLIEITAVFVRLRLRHPPATPASDARQRRPPATPASDARRRHGPARKKLAFPVLRE